MNLGSLITLIGTAPQETGEQPSVFLTFLPFILLFVVFYFLFIRPQTKKQKEMQEMISSLSKGDRVITRGGLIGTIVGVSEKTITIRFGDNFKSEVAKGYIDGKAED